MKFITIWLTEKLNRFIKNSWLVCFCVSAIFVSSCKNEEGNLGLGLIDDDNLLNSTVIDTFTLDTKMILSTDEIISSGASVLMAGAYADDYFGDISAECFFQLRLSDDFKTFGTNATCDSIVLQLDYTGYYYGDTSQSQTLEVYKLSEAMDSDSSYLVTDHIAVSTLLGEETFTAYPNREDELLRIKLDNTYGQEIMDNANMSNSDFVKTIYGINLKAKNNNEGAVLGFSPVNSDSKVIIYYQNDDATEKTYTLNFSSGSKRFNAVSSDKSGTSLSGLMNEGDEVVSSATGNKVFAQASTGIRVLFSIPALGSFRDSVGNISINRAELYLNISPGTNNGEYEEPASSIIVYEYDDNEQIGRDDDGALKVIVTDVQINNGYPVDILNHGYNEDKQYYKVLMTEWVKDYFFKARDNTNIVLSASGNGYTVDRFVVEDNQSSLADKKMKLILYYSKTN